MKNRRHIATAIAILGPAAALLACMDRQPAPVCPVPTELKADRMQTNGFDGVDLLVMVDDSGSMRQEQAILATSFFPLVNSLANPIHTEFPETDWPYPAAESLRLAVITSNMGFSSNGESNDDEWPLPLPTECMELGDDGEFQGIEVPVVTIGSGVIPCDATAAQCPQGWSCDGAGDADGTPGQGVCVGADPSVACPGLEALWAETSTGDPDAEFALRAACLGQQGTDGCGFEQQLASTARALSRDDQEEFIVESHLLAILLVTDEEDCSMKDGAGLFATPEVAEDASKLNIACGEHPEFLFDPADFYRSFVDVKRPDSVVFAAIAGVPWAEEDPAGAAACQGPGHELGDCLAQGSMQLVPEIPEGSTTGNWFYRPACTRYEGVEEVTRASPGRRYVELAHGSFGNMSYVYSICNPDWSPAMTDIAGLIAAHMVKTCYEKPLDWDPVEKVAKCNVVVEFEDEGEECPAAFGPDAEPIIEKATSDDGEEVTLMYCPIPKIPFEQECGDQEADDDELGWYYCENLRAEDFAEACADGIDNDGDGQADCDDGGCAGCGSCPGAAGVECAPDCKYVVNLTGRAREIVGGRQVAVQCLQQFSFEDRNCQEDSREACTDGLDGDGNGLWDCADEEDHLADPSCCPMAVGAGKICLLAPAGAALGWKEICPAGEVEYDDPGDPADAPAYPSACEAAAVRLGCTLP
ncbi:MAG: hypothetical protein M0R80_06295 [Proteobacteria bacterium]|jgi:hypothetical protein|nr:hypothetical protein [Pseudomonadota bacterium]